MIPLAGLVLAMRPGLRQGFGRLLERFGTSGERIAGQVQGVLGFPQRRALAVQFGGQALDLDPGFVALPSDRRDLGVQPQDPGLKHRLRTLPLFAGQPARLVPDLDHLRAQRLGDAGDLKPPGGLVEPVVDPGADRLLRAFATQSIADGRNRRALAET